MKTSRLLSLVLAAGLPISGARATTLNWAAAVSGSASTAGNWNPVQVPTAADFLVFNVAGPTNSAYTVTYNALSQNSSNISVSEDLVTFNILNGHQTGFVRVGNDATPNPTLILDNGTLSATAGVLVGTTLNAVGATVNVRGTNASLSAIGAGVISVGHFGQGVLNITAGGDVQSNSTFVIGNAAGSDGLATVTGSITLPSTFNTSRLIAAGAADLIVGSSGTGELRLGSLSLTSAAHDCVVGLGVGSTGLLSASSLSQLVVGHDLLIGGNATAAAAGNGTLETLPGTQTIDVTNATTVGDVNGGTGLLHMSGGTLTTNSFAVIAGGTFTFDDGTLIVDGGTFSNNSTGLTINSTTGTPTLELRGAQSNAYTASPASIRIGDTGDGSLILRNGRALSGTTGSVAIGIGAGSTGAVTVDTGSTLNTGNAFFFVGNAGTGTLTVSNAGTAHAANTIVANSAAAVGSITVTGAGSLFAADVSASSKIDVGVNSVTNTNVGAGSLSILNGGVVTARANVTTGGSDDSLTITNGTLNAATVEVRSPGPTGCVITNGTVNAQMFRLLNGDATLSGLINAKVEAGSGLSHITLNGDLTAGDALSTAGWVVSGSTIVGSHNLVMLDSNTASTGGTVTLAGGSVRCDSGIVNFATSTISGFGTFHNRVINSGSITATGTGLVFNGILEGTGTGCGGTRFTFGPTGGFTGNGTIAAEVFGNPGSVITANGPLTMGTAVSANGIVIDGLIITGSNAVTLLDNGLASVQDVVLNGGSLRSTTANIATDGTVSGSGTVGGAGREFIVFASSVSRLEPNGTITVLGNYRQASSPGNPGGPGGALEINVTSIAGFDHLTVAGTATLGGPLEGGLVPGGSLNIGDRLTFLTCASRIGTFQTVNVPGFHVEYFANRVDLVFDGLPCDPDVNQDGNVDQDDVSYLINVIGGGSNPTGADPDFNHDGNSDQDDVGALIDVVAGGACP